MELDPEVRGQKQVDKWGNAKGLKKPTQLPDQEEELETDQEWGEEEDGEGIRTLCLGAFCRFLLNAFYVSVYF